MGEVDGACVCIRYVPSEVPTMCEKVHVFVLRIAQ